MLAIVQLKIVVCHVGMSVAPTLLMHKYLLDYMHTGIL